MSIRIRVYPQPGSIGYARFNARKAKAQAQAQARMLQMQTMRLQQQLMTQQARYAPSTMGGQYGSPYGNQYGNQYGSPYGGYNTGITGGMFPTLGYNPYGAPVSANPYGYGYGQQFVGQSNMVNQFNGYNQARSWQFCPTPTGNFGSIAGPAMLGGLGNMFQAAFRGW